MSSWIDARSVRWLVRITQGHSFITAINDLKTPFFTGGLFLLDGPQIISSWYISINISRRHQVVQMESGCRDFLDSEYSLLWRHMGGTASQITSLTIVYSIVYSGADQREHQSSASLAFVRGIPQWPVNSPHKWLVTRKMLPLDDVTIYT